MQKSSIHPHDTAQRLPWFRRLLQYSFLFFLVKGLLWTALLAVPLVKGLAQL